MSRPRKKNSVKDANFSSFKSASFLLSTFSRYRTQRLRNVPHTHIARTFLTEQSHSGEETVSWFSARRPGVPGRPAIQLPAAGMKTVRQDHTQRKQDLVRLIYKYFLARWNNVEGHSPHLTAKHRRCNPRRPIP